MVWFQWRVSMARGIFFRFVDAGWAAAGAGNFADECSTVLLVMVNDLQSQCSWPDDGKLPNEIDFMVCSTIGCYGQPLVYYFDDTVEKALAMARTTGLRMSVFMTLIAILAIVRDLARQRCDFSVHAHGAYRLWRIATWRLYHQKLLDVYEANDLLATQGCGMLPAGPTI